MNDTTRLEVRPEVADFVGRVRARLADLSDEQRDDLLGGLEADISELVADGGSVAELGDPRAYADELRAAAGVVPVGRTGARRPKLPPVPSRESIGGWLDAGRERWQRLMDSRSWLAQSWEVLQTLQPVWWVLRGWVAVELLDVYTGPWEYATLIPRFGDDVSGKLLLVGAVLASVLLGLRRTWPASHLPRSVFARVVLLGLNSFAVLMLFVVVEAFPNSWTLNNAAYGSNSSDVTRPGVVNDGRLVRNVFAYDAEGNPLQGVQLYDQVGKPLAVDPDSAYRMRYAGRLPRIYPWKNGEQDIWNIYPLPLRFGGGWARSDKAWTSDNPPFLPPPPLAAVPPVVLPLPGADSDPDEPARTTEEAPTDQKSGAGQRGTTSDPSR